MYTPTSSITDTPLDNEALKLLSFYAMLASSLDPKGSLPWTNGGSTTNSSRSSISDNPKMTITVDVSTNVVGHGNTVQLPSQAVTEERIKSLLEIAFQNVPNPAAVQDEDDEDAFAVPRPLNVDVKVQAGVNICGSKNVIVLGGGGLRSGSAQGQGQKRKADGEVVDAPEMKKAARSE